MNKYKEGVADIHNNLRKILKGKKKGLQAYKIQQKYSEKFGKLYSESSITARLREIKDVHCNLSTYRYILVGG